MQIIAVVNQSTKLSDGDVAQIARAVNAQLVEDFCPAWSLPPCFMYISHPGIVPEYIPQLILFDNSDQANALGYHFVAPNGMPYSKVFVNDCLNDGVSVSSCVSHEAMEMVLDPSCLRYLPASNGYAYAVEASDAVQRDGYNKNSVEVSNFILPAYFVMGSPGPWDFLGSLAGPFQIAPGGYSIVLKDGQYTTIEASRWAPHPASRLEQRKRAIK